MKEIKPTYGENRVGAMFITPVKALAIDLNHFNASLRAGGHKDYAYESLKMDARVLAGKLMAYEKTKNLIVTNEDDFLLVANVEHPKFKTTILIGGSGNRTFMCYKRSPNSHSKLLRDRVEEWLIEYLWGITPAENVFRYGSRDGWGMLRNNYGQLCFGRVYNVGSSRSERHYEDVYTEASWGAEP